MQASDTEGSISILNYLYKICNANETIDFLLTFGMEMKSLKTLLLSPYSKPRRLNLDLLLIYEHKCAARNLYRPHPRTLESLERDGETQIVQNSHITDKAHRG